MSNNLTADARATGGSGRRPLSSLYRDIGLATVATELNLQLVTFEPEVAEAVERGATALLLAGFGRSLTRHRRSVRLASKAAITRCGAWHARQDSPGGFRHGNLRLRNILGKAWKGGHRRQLFERAFADWQSQSNGRSSPRSRKPGLAASGGPWAACPRGLKATGEAWRRRERASSDNLSLRWLPIVGCRVGRERL
jgi:hypothetical protein